MLLYPTLYAQAFQLISYHCACLAVFGFQLSALPIWAFVFTTMVPTIPKQVVPKFDIAKFMQVSILCLSSPSPRCLMLPGSAVCMRILHFPLPSTCFLFHKTCSVCSASSCKSFPDLPHSVFSFLPLLSSSPDSRQRPFLCKYRCSSLYVESFPSLASYCRILRASSFTSSSSSRSSSSSFSSILAPLSSLNALSWALFAMNITGCPSWLVSRSLPLSAMSSLNFWLVP